MPQTDIAKQLGATIAEKRRSLGLTQAQLAEKLDIGQDALSRMEKGKISPKLTRLPDIAEALDCSVAELFRIGDENSEVNAGRVAEIIKPLTAARQRGIVDIISSITRLPE